MDSIQCLDLVEKAMARGNGVKRPEGADWLEGKGLAISMHGAVPPTEHRSEARVLVSARTATIIWRIGTAEFATGPPPFIDK